MTAAMAVRHHRRNRCDFGSFNQEFVGNSAGGQRTAELVAEAVVADHAEHRDVSGAQGSQVVGGTVNGTGAVIIRAERVGSDTLLSQIVRINSRKLKTSGPPSS